MRTVGITLGEPLGIGPEIVIKTLAKGLAQNQKVIIYGSPRLIQKTSEKFGVHLDPTFVSVCSTGPNPSNGEFESRKIRAEATLASIDRASDDALSGKIDALVTAPIDKSIVREILPTFTGHTGYLAERASIQKTYMLLDNTEIRVLLVTEHIALREVSTHFTQRELERAIVISGEAYKKWFGAKKLRIAVVGLNPHAGEIVSNAEEKTVISPVIARLSNEEVVIEGPFAADSFFSIARNQKWDFIVSPYHDQGLIAAKYPGLDKVLNITLGLPYLRISPGHGVAYDLAGKGKADIRSFERSLKVAFLENWKGSWVT